MHAWSDEDLMRAYQSGDSLAFEVLYRRHAGKVYSYLLKRVKRREEVDEIFQAAFTKFHQARGSYDPAYPVLQWLFVIARTTLLDHQRKAWRLSELTSDAPLDDVMDRVADPSQDPRVPTLTGEKEMAALEALPEAQRKAVAWRVLDEESYEEIAKRLSRSQESVRQIVSRALRQLRLAVGPHGSEEK